MANRAPELCPACGGLETVRDTDEYVFCFACESVLPLPAPDWWYQPGSYCRRTALRSPSRPLWARGLGLEAGHAVPLVAVRDRGVGPRGGDTDRRGPVASPQGGGGARDRAPRSEEPR